MADRRVRFQDEVRLVEFRRSAGKNYKVQMFVALMNRMESILESELTEDEVIERILDLGRGLTSEERECTPINVIILVILGDPEKLQNRSLLLDFFKLMRKDAMKHNFKIFQPKEIITCYARSSDEHRTSLWTDLFIPIYLNHSKVNKQIFEEVQFAIYRILVKDLTTKYRKNKYQNLVIKGIQNNQDAWLKLIDDTIDCSYPNPRLIFIQGSVGTGKSTFGKRLPKIFNVTEFDPANVKEIQRFYANMEMYDINEEVIMPKVMFFDDIDQISPENEQTFFNWLYTHRNTFKCPIICTITSLNVAKKLARQIPSILFQLKLDGFGTHLNTFFSVASSRLVAPYHTQLHQGVRQSNDMRKLINKLQFDTSAKPFVDLEMIIFDKTFNELKIFSRKEETDKGDLKNHTRFVRNLAKANFIAGKLRRFEEEKDNFNKFSSQMTVNNYPDLYDNFNLTNGFETLNLDRANLHEEGEERNLGGVNLEDSLFNMLEQLEKENSRGEDEEVDGQDQLNNSLLNPDVPERSSQPIPTLGLHTLHDQHHYLSSYYSPLNTLKEIDHHFTSKSTEDSYCVVEESVADPHYITPVDEFPLSHMDLIDSLVVYKVRDEVYYPLSDNEPDDKYFRQHPFHEYPQFKGIDLFNTLDTMYHIKVSGAQVHFNPEEFNLSTTFHDLVPINDLHGSKISVYRERERLQKEQDEKAAAEKQKKLAEQKHKNRFRIQPPVENEKEEGGQKRSKRQRAASEACGEQIFRDGINPNETLNRTLPEPIEPQRKRRKSVAPV